MCVCFLVLSHILEHQITIGFIDLNLILCSAFNCIIKMSICFYFHNLGKSPKIHIIITVRTHIESKHSQNVSLGSLFVEIYDWNFEEMRFDLKQSN